MFSTSMEDIRPKENLLILNKIEALITIDILSVKLIHQDDGGGYLTK